MLSRGGDQGAGNQNSLLHLHEKVGYSPDDIIEYFFEQISMQPDDREHLI
jgi:hypothetical protein